MNWIIIDHAENLWLDDYAIQIKKLNVVNQKRIGIFLHKPATDAAIK